MGEGLQDVFIDVPKLGCGVKRGLGSVSESIPGSSGSVGIVQRLEVSGAAPSARGGHSATACNNKIYIFGGHELKGSGRGFIYHDALHILDLSALQWVSPSRSIIKGTPPAARYGHSACLYSSKILIFGGRGGPCLYYNDLHAYDTHTDTWLVGKQSNKNPLPRFLHSCTLYKDKLYLFGGARGPTLLNDVFCLDINSLQWTQLNTKGSKPSPRAAHAAAIADKYLLIYGGLIRAQVCYYQIQNK